MGQRLASSALAASRGGWSCVAPVIGWRLPARSARRGLAEKAILPADAGRHLSRFTRGDCESGGASLLSDFCSPGIRLPWVRSCTSLSFFTETRV